MTTRIFSIPLVCQKPTQLLHLWIKMKLRFEYKYVTFKYILSSQCLDFIKRTCIKGCQRPFFKFIPTAKKTYESLFLTQLKQKGGKRRRSAMCSGLGFLQVFFKETAQVYGGVFNTKKKTVTT